MSITEFLLARVAEDEALLAVPKAKRMIGRKVVEVPFERLPVYVERDRDRWLAECEAKRRIVADHGSREWSHGTPTCGTCRPQRAMDEWDEQTWPCTTIRALAAVYSDHQDFDPDWHVSG